MHRIVSVLCTYTDQGENDAVRSLANRGWNHPLMVSMRVMCAHKEIDGKRRQLRHDEDQGEFCIMYNEQGTGWDLRQRNFHPSYGRTLHINVYSPTLYG